jgi:hypothetical protein
LCNAHHLRELIFFEEEEKAPWATSLRDLLLFAKTSVESAKNEGKDHLDPAILQHIDHLYRQTLRRSPREYTTTRANRQPGEGQKYEAAEFHRASSHPQRERPRLCVRLHRSLRQQPRGKGYPDDEAEAEDQRNLPVLPRRAILRENTGLYLYRPQEWGECLRGDRECIFREAVRCGMGVDSTDLFHHKFIT